MEFTQVKLDFAQLRDISAQLLTKPPLAVALTVAAFVAGLALQKKWPHVLLFNPTLIGIILVSSTLSAIGVSYPAYLTSTQSINFMLGPTVVLLAVPIYKNRLIVSRSWMAICAGVTVGVVVAFLSTLLISRVCGAKAQTFFSLSPKSVTTGIAVGISEIIGGIPALTAVFVICTGIIGAVFGSIVLKLAGVRDERAIGLAMGISAHGIGTARAMQISEVAGTFSGIGMALNGISTAIVLPLLFTLIDANKYEFIFAKNFSLKYLSELKSIIPKTLYSQLYFVNLHARLNDLLLTFCFIFMMGILTVAYFAGNRITRLDRSSAFRLAASNPVIYLRGLRRQYRRRSDRT
jgi:predicted murein hydrolase (TIGR00659 family)